MSFWTDIRDTVEGAVSTVANVYTAGYRAVGQFGIDTVEGKNIVSSAGSLASKEFGANLPGFSAGNKIILQQDQVQSTLNKLSPYTLGVTGNFANVGKETKALDSSSDPAKWSDTRSLGISYGTLAAEGGAAYAGVAGAGALGLTGTGGALVGGTTGLGASAKFLKGDIGGGLSTIGSSLVPDEWKDDYNTASTIAGDVFGPSSPGGTSPTRSLGSSNPPTVSGYPFSTLGSTAGGKSITPYVVLGVVGIYLIMRYRHAHH